MPKTFFYQQSLRPVSVLIIECRLSGWAGADSVEQTFELGPAQVTGHYYLNSTPGFYLQI
jgi:hypothetical protein